MAAAGAIVTETDPGFADPVECFRTLWWAGAGAALAHVSDHSRLDPGLARALDEAKGITLDSYLAATRARGALGAQMRGFMQDYDPVSYTHLDVYKRQALRGPVCIGAGRSG